MLKKNTSKNLPQYMLLPNKEFIMNKDLGNKLKELSIVKKDLRKSEELSTVRKKLKLLITEISIPATQVKNHVAALVF